jgi:adenylylsulfate kinase
MQNLSQVFSAVSAPLRLIIFVATRDQLADSQRVNALKRIMQSGTGNIFWHLGMVDRAARQRLLKQKGVTVWLTGLSGSGKSTIGCIVEEMLLKKGKLAYRIDGDNTRMGLTKNLSFSADDRAENIRRVGEVAKLFTDAGVICIACFISPYRRDRDQVRISMQPGDFIEVYVRASLAAAEKRDPKGLYKKARAGEIQGFTGIDDPYEPPARAEIELDTETTSAAAAADQIVAYLETNGYLHD